MVRGVAAGRPAEEGKRIVREGDGRGLHTTGALRERAYEPIEAAETDRT